METRWLHQDSIEYIIAETYAHAKGYLFEIFFGWRKTTSNGMSKIVLTRRGWKKVDEMIKYYEVFHKNS